MAPAGAPPSQSAPAADYPDRVLLTVEDLLRPMRNALDVWCDIRTMGHQNQQHAIPIIDPSPLARALTLHVSVYESGTISVNRGHLDLSSRRMVFEQVGTLSVEDIKMHSDGDVLAIAAFLNLDEEQSAAPW